MATNIPELNSNSVLHAVLIDLTIDDTTYYISSAYKPLSYDGNTYTELGALLQVGSITNDIKTTNGDVSVSLSGIPSEANYVQLILDPSKHIRGGKIIIRRAFFNTSTIQVSEVYERYRGIIINAGIEEDTSYLTGELSQTATITCASLNTLLENRVTGQRTNQSSRQQFYPGDISFNRVKDLQNTSFDFGKDFSYGNGYGGRGGGGGGGGYPGFDPRDFNFQLP